MNIFPGCIFMWDCANNSGLPRSFRDHSVPFAFADSSRSYRLWKVLLSAKFPESCEDDVQVVQDFVIAGIQEVQSLDGVVGNVRVF